jgi:hypothetical protein
MNEDLFGEKRAGLRTFDAFRTAPNSSKLKFLH